MLFELILFASLMFIGYTYFVYPLMIAARAKLLPRPFESAEITPSVTLVVAAHNEQQSIGNRIENLLQLDYPQDCLQVIVASDGSTDQTVAIAERYRAEGIECLDLPRQGKAKTINAAMERARGEIIVFSDANSSYAADAVRRLVAPFADQHVGGVAGDQRYREPTGDRDHEVGERSYWNFDRRLKAWQSAAGNVISATGAIYAIRRSLFVSIPDGVTDDFVTSTRVIQQGYRLVFAPDAAAFEPVAAKDEVEFGRKVRVITRGLNGVLENRSLLNPIKYGFYSVQLFSHKVLRRMVVLPLITTFIASAILTTLSPIYLAFFIGQVAFYSAAILGYLLRDSVVGHWKVLRLPAYFCLVNIAALIALLNLFRGRRIDRWEPQRGAESAVTA